MRSLLHQFIIIVFSMSIILCAACSSVASPTGLSYSPMEDIVMSPSMATNSIENNPTNRTPVPAPNSLQIQIDAQAEEQTIEGFGASGAWWAQDVGGWEDSKRNLIADLLFDKEKGIGLSVYRYNIGGGDGESISDPWRRSIAFDLGSGQYDWTRDANAVWMLRAARDRGVVNFVAFVNSPPARMTVSGVTTGGKNGESNLGPSMYADFSQYLIDVVNHLQNTENIHIGWISPVNEPQWNWSSKNGQEGCHYGPDEVLELARVLLQTLKERNSDAQLSLFESGEWKSSSAYIDKLASDPQVWAALPHISIHSYWSTQSDKIQFMNYLEKQHPGKALWMSEWTEMQDGRDTGIRSALVLASTMHDDLTIANVTSWQDWIAVSKYQYHDGLIYVDTADRNVLPTKRLWAMGNFSRFVLPGYVRLDVQGGDDLVMVSAYRSPDQKRFVVVVVNLTYKPVSALLDFTKGQMPIQAEQYETSEENNLALVRTGPTSSPWLLAPRSVTTLVMDGT